MSTYIAPKNGHVFRIDSLEAPGYVKEFLNHAFVIKNLAPRTISNYFLQIRAFLRWYKCRGCPIKSHDEFQSVDIMDVQFDSLAALTVTDIYEYLSFSSSVLNNGTVSRALKLTAVKSFYDYYCELNRIDSNPAATVKAPKKEKLMPKYLDIDESILLLQAVAGDSVERDYCIITLFINCGMRLSELVGIDLKDIRDDTLRLYGKGRKERIVYLNDACMSSISDYLCVRTSLTKIIDKEAMWLSKRTGKRLSGRRIEQIVEQALLRAGLSDMGYSPHKLRHTAASLMYQNGSASILELKEILGHENTSTTEIYTHLHRDQLRDAVRNAPLAHVKRGKEYMCERIKDDKN